MWTSPGMESQYHKKQHFQREIPALAPMSHKAVKSTHASRQLTIRSNDTNGLRRLRPRRSSSGCSAKKHPGVREEGFSSQEVDRGELATPSMRMRPKVCFRRRRVVRRRARKERKEKVGPSHERALTCHRRPREEERRERGFRGGVAVREGSEGFLAAPAARELTSQPPERGVALGGGSLSIGALLPPASAPPVSPTICPSHSPLRHTIQTILPFLPTRGGLAMGNQSLAVKPRCGYGVGCGGASAGAEVEVRRVGSIRRRNRDGSSRLTSRR